MRKEKLQELKQYIEELKTIRTFPSLEKSSFLTTEKNCYYLNNGACITRELLKKQGKSGSAVIALPITEKGTTLLVVEPRIGTKRTVAVGLPAGYIEEGEKPEVAIARELEEETGYQCEKYYLLAQYYQDPGCSQAYNYAFLGTKAQKVMKQSLDPEEYIRYFECQYEEALELVDMGYIEDLQAQFVLEKAKTYIYK